MTPTEILNMLEVDTFASVQKMFTRASRQVKRIIFPKPNVNKLRAEAQSHLGWSSTTNWLLEKKFQKAIDETRVELMENLENAEKLVHNHKGGLFYTRTHPINKDVSYITLFDFSRCEAHDNPATNQKVTLDRIQQEVAHELKRKVYQWATTGDDLSVETKSIIRILLLEAKKS